MSLYDRSTIGYEEARRESSISLFIKKTYQLFAASLLSATAGAYCGLLMASAFIGNSLLFYGLVIIEIALLIGLHFAKEKEGLNLILLFAFTFVSGLTLTPLLYSVLALPSGASIVAQAFTLTTVAFGGLSIFAMNTKRDFSTMGKMLFIGLIVLFVASIIGIFFHSPVFHLVISSISAILFSAYILYDTQNIIKGRYDSPVIAAVALYLDFINLFTSLLRIFGILSKND